MPVASDERCLACQSGDFVCVFFSALLFRKVRGKNEKPMGEGCLTSLQLSRGCIVRLFYELQVKNTPQITRQLCVFRLRAVVQYSTHSFPQSCDSFDQRHGSIALTGSRTKRKRRSCHVFVWGITISSPESALGMRL